jgi:hypothetical protein
MVAAAREVRLYKKLAAGIRSPAASFFILAHRNLESMFRVR